MKIIAGLGNPGPKYETTRHNVGFLAVDRLIDRWQATGPQILYEGAIYQATVRGEKVLLIKPQTYMNNSGRCVAPLFKFYKCKSDDLIVIHDELDLKRFMIRIKTGGGAGGHNGIKSVDAHLGAGFTDYPRVRIGIGRPSPLDPKSISPVDYVLQPFSDEELLGLDSVLDDVTKAVLMMLQGDVKSAMNQFNNKERT